MEVVDSMPRSRVFGTVAKLMESMEVGVTYKLTIGVDFDVSITSFRNALSDLCRRRGVAYITRKKGNFFYIQLLAKSDNSPSS